MKIDEVLDLPQGAAVTIRNSGKAGRVLYTTRSRDHGFRCLVEVDGVSAMYFPQQTEATAVPQSEP